MKKPKVRQWIGPWLFCSVFISSFQSYVPVIPKDLLSPVTAKLESKQQFGCYVVNALCFTSENFWKSFKTPNGNPKVKVLAYEERIFLGRLVFQELLKSHNGSHQLGKYNTDSVLRLYRRHFFHPWKPFKPCECVFFFPRTYPLYNFKKWIAVCLCPLWRYFQLM